MTGTAQSVPFARNSEAGVGPGPVIDPMRDAAQFVLRVLEVGAAPVRGLARLGSDSLPAALLAVLGGADPGEVSEALPGPPAGVEGAEPPTAAEMIPRAVGRARSLFIRLEVTERAGMGSRAGVSPQADENPGVEVGAQQVLRPSPLVAPESSRVQLQ